MPDSDNPSEIADRLLTVGDLRSLLDAAADATRVWVAVDGVWVSPIVSESSHERVVLTVDTVGLEESE